RSQKQSQPSWVLSIMQMNLRAIRFIACLHFPARPIKTCSLIVTLATRRNKIVHFAVFAFAGYWVFSIPEYLNHEIHFTFIRGGFVRLPDRLVAEDGIFHTNCRFFVCCFGMERCYPRLRKCLEIGT